MGPRTHIKIPSDTIGYGDLSDTSIGYVSDKSSDKFLSPDVARPLPGSQAAVSVLPQAQPLMPSSEERGCLSGWLLLAGWLADCGLAGWHTGLGYGRLD